MLEEKRRRKVERKYLEYFPDTGPLRRELYPKHIAFFRAGTRYRERLMLAANRVGKTESVGLYEVMLHATGLYPDWWEGRRYTKPIRAWVAGDTGKTVREILQLKLLGPVGQWGTGLIPKEKIGRISKATGIPDAVDAIYIKHTNNTGPDSVITLKSYDQRRESFQGAEPDIILLDEEPPEDIYTECLIRTMTNKGMILMTFTPLMGMTNLILNFLPGGRIQEGEASPSRYVVTATWDDVPHLSDEDKAELMGSIPPHQRDARSKGVPQLGSGAVYPIQEELIVVKPFKIPEHWPRAYGLDVGWRRTAAVWGAMDPGTGRIYLYSEHYLGQAEPEEHVKYIKARGTMAGVIDPASRGRSQKDGEQLLEIYRDLGLDLWPADNAVEAGITSVWLALQSGQLAVFSDLQDWLGEYRLYRRDQKGKVIKKDDHLMDATRYLKMSGFEMATSGNVLLPLMQGKR